ncbi:quinol:cytochrome c oxidoreductase quinone-binding subunit 2 [Flavobacterium cutihirudinis]|uniref:Quinol:cytochrome c oxidoreductase quinone-binding subunit 2 n=1 Tax=Flavobacterium cutihirudinis TaxID=1265740 RepID=A0A3D9FXP5_9FLAO|nr:quinol:cytochrome C oxidoreductase [Flavobacterium cutihirudinis]RED25526.1 quinol:cytochrome c oxidoreductase quinone-binding subunit 2 [Flavobacterium cutihirudinis]
MYTFSSKLKTFSFILMAVGILGIGYGFLKAPKNIEEVEALLAKEASEHGGGHGEAAAAHHEAAAEATHHVESEAVHHEEAAAASAEVAVNKDSVVSSKDSVIAPEAKSEEAHAPAVKDEVKNEKHAEVSHEGHDPKAHAKHVLHQLQNKPWSALYVACIFFLLLSMGVLAFYAIQQVAQAGWSPVLFRVMQGITAYLPAGSIIFFIILVLCGLHFNHIFVWLGEGVTDPSHANYDAIIAGKSGYLNFPFWIARAFIFLLGWNLYRHYSAKNCLAQDEANDDLYYKKNFKISAGFLVFFIVSESIMSWDWIMSFDPHWFSTLFGWYVFASFFVSGITSIALVTIYLKSKGYLEYVNTSHIHDLAKFMFGISVFWTYLWFSQFMLIWYANIPEEVTYFVTRIQLYNLPFFGAVVMNFVFPLLILINTDFKRLNWVIVMAGIVILLGHYVDFFNMIMPGTVGDQWFIGVPEIASILFFLGLFIFVVFTALTKAPLLAKRNPFIEESKHFHY